MRKLERGDSAEWCPKCKVNVLPVGFKAGVIQRWGCPACRTSTVPHD